VIATAAPIVAVFRRGPAAWSHVGRWDLDALRYEPGAWLRGRLFPRRSDLSPDGRWLCYFAHKPTARWEHGEAYVAVSRLPWLTALHAFATCGTWTRGYHFARDSESDATLAPPLAGAPIPYALRSTPAVQFETERRRGWEEAPDSPPRAPGDAWDQHRNARMQKRQPGGERLLTVESLGWAGGEFGSHQAVDGLRVRYALEVDGNLTVLDDLQWADWDSAGRLLAATRAGALQVRVLGPAGMATIFSEDLTRFEPEPVAPPAWAHEW
jgi:hypothetical protein